MEKKIKNIKISSVTPMLSHGGDGKSPEIRIPEFKSAMRFWWRALSYFEVKEDDELDYFNKMRAMEGKIFGDAKKNASPISIRLKNIKNRNIKKYNYGIRGFEKVEFEMSLILKYPQVLSQIDYWNFNKYYSLLEIVSILGGVGQRIRRGYGVFRIDNSNIYLSINLNFLKNKINEIFGNIYKVAKSKYILEKNVIARKKECKPNCGFSYVEEIFIGKEVSFNIYKENIERAIWKNFNKKNEYKNTKRYACPVYISACYKKDTNSVIPIITILYNTQIREDNENYYKYKRYVSNIIGECIK
ncbi:type III-B CRISPR module RAMP protein Cmr1 [Tepidibacter thalassicus]|nr:type III-B CRISPR module RAMP protein Cmr1 [Tepidibacter thalassicus]